VTIPEPATLLDDDKARAPEVIADQMTSNRIILRPEYKKMITKDPQLKNMSRDELTRHIYQIYIKGCYRLIKRVDDNVGGMLEYLDESGLAKNTLVIYSSDQGFALGEHGFYDKQWMYEPSLHQPLIVRFPGVAKPGTVHDSMVNHVDIAPTLLDFAGRPIPSGMQGYSLRPILGGGKSRQAA
jgi:arylsulfatase A-like enzyme